MFTWTQNALPSLEEDRLDYGLRKSAQSKDFKSPFTRASPRSDGSFSWQDAEG